MFFFSFLLYSSVDIVKRQYDKTCSSVFTEAVETILSFSKNAEEFLRRKKVQRDLIFKYLVNEGVVMPPNSEKHQLVKRTLELWSSGKVGFFLCCGCECEW